MHVKVAFNFSEEKFLPYECVCQRERERIITEVKDLHADDSWRCKFHDAFLACSVYKETTVHLQQLF
jgi:hypothetical protein